MPVEQPHTEIRFQPMDALGQRGLRNAGVIRRCMQRLVLRRSKKQLDLAELHNRYPSVIATACLYHLARMEGNVSLPA